MKIHKLFKNEEGSALVIIALTLTVFFGFTALVADGGVIYLTSSRLSNAADAAALAGAQELPGNPVEAVKKAKEYAAANNVTLKDSQIEILENNTAIKVTADKNVEFFFARFLGFNSSMVNAKAVARIAPITSINGVVPLGIDDFPFVVGQEYTLKEGAQGQEQGWFRILALEGPGAKLYLENLKHGYSGTINVGDIINIQTGNISGNTKKGIDYRMAECKHVPACNAGSFNRNCARLLKVPIIKEHSHRKVQVLGFAMFLVDSVAGQGRESIIKGRFIETVVSGETSDALNSYGLYGVKLAQ